MCRAVCHCSAAEAQCPGDADHSHIPGCGGGAGRASRRGDYLPGAERHPHGKSKYHRTAASLGGDPWGGERGLFGQDGNPDPEPDDSGKVLAGRRIAAGGGMRAKAVSGLL